MTSIGYLRSQDHFAIGGKTQSSGVVIVILQVNPPYFHRIIRSDSHFHSGCDLVFSAMKDCHMGKIRDLHIRHFTGNRLLAG